MLEKIDDPMYGWCVPDFGAFQVYYLETVRRDGRGLVKNFFTKDSDGHNLYDAVRTGSSEAVFSNFGIAPGAGISPEDFAKNAAALEKLAIEMKVPYWNCDDDIEPAFYVGQTRDDLMQQKGTGFLRSPDAVIARVIQNEDTVMEFLSRAEPRGLLNNVSLIVGSAHFN